MYPHSYDDTPQENLRRKLEEEHREAGITLFGSLYCREYENIPQQMLHVAHTMKAYAAIQEQDDNVNEEAQKSNFVAILLCCSTFAATTAESEKQRLVDEVILLFDSAHEAFGTSAQAA